MEPCECVCVCSHAIFAMAMGLIKFRCKFKIGRRYLLVQRDRRGRKERIETKLNSHQPLKYWWLLWLYVNILMTVILHTNLKSQLDERGKMLGDWPKTHTLYSIRCMCRLNLMADYRRSINIEMNYRFNADEGKKCVHSI